MADFDPEFELIAKRANERHEREVYDAYHHTLAGLETGYLLKTFLKKAKLEAKQFEQLYRQMLSDLLRDPVYAKLYNDTKALVNHAQTIAESALDRVRSELAEALDTLNETLDNANKLPDGTIVFKDANNNYVTKNGRLLTPQEQAQLVWRNTGVSYEDYVAQRDAVDLLQKHEQQLEHYQDHVIAPIQDKMDDQENPPSKSDLHDFQKQIRDQAPLIIRNELEQKPVSNEQEPITSTGNIQKPVF